MGVDTYFFGCEPSLYRLSRLSSQILLCKQLECINDYYRVQSFCVLIMCSQLLEHSAKFYWYQTVVSL